ncbi:MAG: NAD(+) diphosphatase [Spirochaetales bacterium]|nr:NAD(+) diphosphatase [Spirochaetales bacterium]
MSFHARWGPVETPSDTDYLVLLDDDSVLFHTDENRLPLFNEAAVVTETQQLIHLGDVNGSRILLGLSAPKETESLRSVPLRSLLAVLDNDQFKALSAAKTTFHWLLNNRYCGRCGSITSRNSRERSIFCPACGHTIFPKISPAVIVAVINGDQILLAHNKRFSTAMYSLVAGFIDPGEDINAAAVREVKEETDIEIANLRFFSSQPWPFPDSLMIGLIADYKSGTPSADGDEVDDARWFYLNDLPQVPGKGSIARTLLEYLCPYLSSQP